MFGFGKKKIKRRSNADKLASKQYKLEKLKLKVKEKELQMKLLDKENEQEVSHWERLRENKEAINSFAKEVAEEYQLTGIEKLLHNPFVQQFLSSLFVKHQGNKDNMKRELQVKLEDLKSTNNPLYDEAMKYGKTKK